MPQNRHRSIIKPVHYQKSIASAYIIDQNWSKLTPYYVKRISDWMNTKLLLQKPQSLSKAATRKISNPQPFSFQATV
jgi:hypothetical protein